MTAKWLAVVLMWVAAGATVVGTAAAWGVQGRGTTLVLGIVLGLVVGIATGIIATADVSVGGNDD